MGPAVNGWIKTQAESVPNKNTLCGQNLPQGIKAV
jgi:hypothetical protein